MENTEEIIVIDTNVLLRNPRCIFGFPEGNIIIPLNVIEELDHFRTQISENGRNSREFLEILEGLRGGQLLTESIHFSENATLTIYLADFKERIIPDYLDMKKNPNRMLHTMLELKEKYKGTNKTAVLLTNDYGLRIRAASFGIKVREHKEEEFHISEIYEGISVIQTDDQEHYDFFLKNKAQTYDPSWPEPYPNMFFTLRMQGQKDILCRYYKQNNLYREVEGFPRGIWNIFPRNAEQMAALNLLTDKKISIVALAGKAGTGKTLLALAAALEQLFEGDHYRKILVSRPIVPMGRELGFIPGDINEKLQPWMQPIFDNLEFLMAKSGGGPGKFRDVSYLMGKNLIELEALSYIRGRSIPNRYMIVDEAQNLTPHEVKTIITRVGEGTKIVLTGDPFQIDNAYLDSTSNGLTYIMERLKPYDPAGHVNLQKGERSPLAELAANVL